MAHRVLSIAGSAGARVGDRRVAAANRAGRCLFASGRGFGLTVVLVLAATACGKRSALKPDGSTIEPTLDGGANDTIDRDAGGAGGAGGAAGGADAGGLDVARPDVGGSIAACAPDISTRVPPAPLRRLTNFAYDNTLRDQLGVAQPSHALPPAADVSDDPTTLGLLVDAYHGNAHDVALAATKDAASVAALTQCDPGALGEATCAQRFVAAFVPQVFRRPLEAGDAADFGDVFAKGREMGGDYASGVRAVVEVALQSPEFLYLVEFGEPVDPGQPGVGRPRPYEMAARLSYLLLGSAPDDGLRAAAAQDQLKTREQVEQQAVRLLADQRAHDVTRDFYTRLLRAGELESRPVLSPALAASAGAETTVSLTTLSGSRAAISRRCSTRPSRSSTTRSPRSMASLVSSAPRSGG